MLKEDYLPVSNVSVISKMFEKLLWKQKTPFGFYLRTNVDFEEVSVLSIAFLPYCRNRREHLRPKNLFDVFLADLSKTFVCLKHDHNS